MGVREDIICDDFKTVRLPHLNYMFSYEEIDCDGYDMDGNLKIPGLAKCEETYPCVLWKDDYYNKNGGLVESNCSTTELFSHCSQCNICVHATEVQV